MNKRYKITLPSPEKCAMNGFKWEGQEVRTRLWLTGVAAGVSYVSGVHFNVFFTTKSALYIETDSLTVLNNVKDWLESYCCTVEEVEPVAS